MNHIDVVLEWTAVEWFDAAPATAVPPGVAAGPPTTAARNAKGDDEPVLLTLLAPDALELPPNNVQLLWERPRPVCVAVATAQ
jgi:hypothetical protein